MPHPWVLLTATLAIQAMASMAVITLPVMAPAVAQATGIPLSYAGVYIAVLYVGAMLLSLTSGTLVARYGAIRASQLGLLLCAVGLGFCAIPSLPVMAVGAFLIGVGYGPITPASSHLLAKSTPPHRLSLVFSIKQTGVPLGGVLAGAVIPGAALWMGWQGALGVAAAMNLVCILLAQPLRQRLDDDRDPARLLALSSLMRPIRLVVNYRALRLLAACSFVFSMVQVSLTTYLVSYLNVSLGYSLVAAGLALSITQAAGIIGRVLWGWMADRFMGAQAMLRTLATIMVLSALATALLQPSWPALLVLAILVVFGASAIGWNGVYLAEVARQAPPGMAGLATGGTLTVTFFGVVVGLPLFGALVSMTGSYRVSFALLAIPTAVCLASLWRNTFADPAASR